MSQPTILQKLKNELEVAIPQRDAHVSLVSLEQLPYLIVVCKEGLRLNYGGTNRLPRVVPDAIMPYKSWKISPGTLVSMGIVSTHHNRETVGSDDIWVENH